MITEYVKGKPYFCDTDEKIEQFPYLDKNIECDVLIVGGGIDGMITHYYFSHANIDCVLIDKKRLGYENTGSATALLEYQLDDHANDLTEFFSKEDLVKVYQVGLDALKEIDNLISKWGNQCYYSKRNALIYSLEDKDKDEIGREYQFRKDNNFAVKLIDENNNSFGIPIKIGLMAYDGGAEFNPYLFEKQLVENRKKKNSRIFENTEATKIIKEINGFRVITNYGIEIKCNKIICATGYNTKLFTPDKLCDKFISYTIVTQPLKGINFDNKTLLQDNSDPYHYIRLSHDNRLIIGGEDIPFKNDTIKEKVAEKKYKALLEYAEKILPRYKDKFNVEYKFCGAFSSTSNNLAVIGRSKEDDNIWYALGYGANGIIYCIYGAKLLLNLYNNKSTVCEEFFSPRRDLP